MMRTFKVYSPSYFQIYNKVLVTIITVLTIPSPRCSYFKGEDIEPQGMNDLSKIVYIISG